MNEVDRTFWRNKRVLVTGHTGFKGSWLSLWLTEMGAEVTGMALEPEGRNNLFKNSSKIERNLQRCSNNFSAKTC